MRPAVVLGALFLATLGVALWAFGVFEPSKPPPVEPPRNGTTTPPTTNGGDLATVEPTEEPPLDPVPITRTVRVLTLANAPRSFTQWLYQGWDKHDRIEYQAWSANLPDGVEPAHSPLLSPLTSPPEPDLLNDVQVLILDELDPKAMSSAFWDKVAVRVRSGAMGLFIHPGVEHGHALATHGSIAPLLPIQAKRVAGLTPGGPVAGVSEEERPFFLTPEGATHPLTRLVRFPGWSAKKWQAFVSGPKPWGTKFVHPTGDRVPGSVVLLEVKDHRGERVPALVASDPAKGRVLWVGFHDVGDPAYRDGVRSASAIRALSLAWLAWLAGLTA